jgi:hypothetical protein
MKKKLDLDQLLPVAPGEIYGQPTAARRIEAT